jgi:transposase-like protein
MNGVPQESSCPEERTARLALPRSQPFSSVITYDKVPVSKVCEEANIQPSQFYLWQRQAFENLEVVLESRRSKPGAKERKLQERVDHLEAKLARKDHVIAVISEDHVALKKELGEP